MRVAIYDSLGRIDRLLSLTQGQLETNIKPGEQWLEVGDDFQDELFYIHEGKPVKLPPKPGVHYRFDYRSRSWIVDQQEVAQAMRSQRNRLLASSDWTQLPDVPLATKDSWAVYRQALRDLTEQPGYPFDIVWPEPPN